MFDVCLITAQKELWQDQWSYILSHWSPRNIYVLGDIDSRLKPFREAIQIDHAYELPDIPLVVMQPETAQFIKPTISLPKFEHPEECVYLFGNDNTHLSIDQLEETVPDFVVSIPTDTHDQMYSWVAGGVTLYDRAVKHG